MIISIRSWGYADGECCLDPHQHASNRPRGLLLRVNYGELNVDLWAKLECRIFGAVWPLIWWVLGRGQAAQIGYHRYPTRFDTNSTLICLMAVSFDSMSTLFRHYYCEFEDPVVYT